LREWEGLEIPEYYAKRAYIVDGSWNFGIKRRMRT